MAPFSPSNSRVLQQDSNTMEFLMSTSMTLNFTMLSRPVLASQRTCHRKPSSSMMATSTCRWSSKRSNLGCQSTSKRHITSLLTVGQVLQSGVTRLALFSTKTSLPQEALPLKSKSQPLPPLPSSNKCSSVQQSKRLGLSMQNCSEKTNVPSLRRSGVWLRRRWRSVPSNLA